MKALLITAVASFFALTVSAQTTTDTKATVTPTGTQEKTRPAKVATSTATPTVVGATMPTKSKDANAPATTPASTLTEGPASKKEAPIGVSKDVKADNPGSQKLSAGRRDRPVMKDETPKE